MGTGSGVTYEHELVSTIPPARLFKAYILDSDNLIPKITPNVATSMVVLEGDGGAGTVKLITLGKDSQFKSAKHRVDELDEAKLTYKFSAIEIDDAFGDGAIESISYEVRIVEGPEGGSVVKRRTSYHTKMADYSVTEEVIKESKDKAKAYLDAVEAYLHANPHEYI